MSMNATKKIFASMVLAAMVVGPTTSAQAGYGYGRFHDVVSDFAATFLGRAAVDELVKAGESFGK